MAKTFASLLALAVQQETVVRAPLPRTSPDLVPPKTWTLRERSDSSGRVTPYDPKPTVQTIDRRSGLFDLVWVGGDGQPKRVRYQRPDAIEAVVKADAVPLADGRFEYSYTVENLASSGQELTGFSVQTMAPDVVTVALRPVLNRMLTGLLGPADWWRFSHGRDFLEKVEPGKSVVVRLRSEALAGQVECAVDGGARVMKGVGEEVPDELLAALPGYEAWPRGRTIGPMASLRSMPLTQRLDLLQRWILEWPALGWVSGATARTYADMITGRRTAELVRTAETDLRRGAIAQEVVVLIRSATHQAQVTARGPRAGQVAR